MSQSLFAATWYVRADGGTRFSAGAPAGQCDGLADTAYPGSGTNQHCAFGDYRFLWDDQSYGNLGWVIAGGDTVILDNTKQWRVGFDTDGYSDAWCWGGGGPYSCYNPPIPPGTPSQHTRILGRNYATCSNGNAADPSKMTQIFGGHGIYTALNLKGAQYVDVQCMEITRHSQCITHGSPVYPSGCSTSPPIDDFDSDGIQTDVNTHDLLLQDLWVHGHTDRGILGPIGGKVAANRIDIAYNGMAGWDFDDGNGTASINGTLNFSHSMIEWNGCNQEYPIVHTYPAISCYSQSSGGYGDGIGTPAGMGMNVSIDHSTFRYNTQDGEDFGHIDTGSSTLSITDSLSYANNGGQFKWGPAFTSVLFENNLVVGNCLRMSQPVAGAPSTFNTNLGDYCRAQDALSFNFIQGSVALFANNTIVSYAPTTFDMQCADSSCSSTVFTLTNNVVRGYDNPTTYNMGGQVGGPGSYCGAYCNSSTQPIGTINRYHNSYFGVRNCPAGIAVGSTGGTISGETCNDPLFTGEPPSFTTEAALDNYTFALSAGSPAVDSGIAVAGLTTDYNGVTRPGVPSLGAMQFVAGVQVPVLSFAAIANQTYGAAPFAVTAVSASSGAVSYAVTSGPATILGNMVTLTGAGSVSLSATQVAAGGYTTATAAVNFSVSAEVPTLRFAAIANQSFGGAPFSVSASSVSSGTVTYSVISGPATVTGSTVTLTGAGVVVLSASQAAAGNYASAATTVSFSVAAEVPALSFAAIANQTYGAAPFAVTAVSASSGAVSYAVTSGPATILGNMVTLTGAGSVSLSAIQVAVNGYSTATAAVNFSVSAEVPTLRFAAIANQSFGGAPFSVSASSVSSGTVSYTVVSGPAAIAGSTVTLTGAGMVVLSASQAAAGNYASATTTVSFSVAAEVPTLRFAAIGNHSFGGPPFSVSASSLSSGTVSYTVVSGPATIAGSTVTLTGAGMVVLSASQAAAGNYASATTTVSFSVAAEVPTLSYAAIANQTYGTGPFAVVATSASTGAVTYAVVSGPATLAGSTVTLTGVGTVVLNASQAAAGNYASATTTLSFNVAAEMPVLHFAAITNRSFGSAPFSVSASSVSSGTVTYSVLSGPATLAGSTVTLTGVGTVVLSASQAAAGNYASATTTISFSVAAEVPVFSFAPIASQSFGSAPFGVSASSVSSGTVTYSVLSGPATLAGSTVTLTGAGMVVLSASQAAMGNYASATTTLSFSVAAEVPTLSFAPIANQSFGAAPFSVSASSASSGMVSYAVVSGPATLAGSAVTVTGAGTVIMRASQAAAGNYATATAVTSFTVSPEATPLVFAPIASQSFGNAPFAVSASSTSSGAITYTLSSGPATLSGNTVSLTGAGIVSLRANQAASGNYAPEWATMIFNVAPEVTSLSFSAIAGQVFGNPPVIISASSASNGNVTYAVVSGPATITGSTMSLTGAGTVVLSANQAATGNYTAATASTSFLVSPQATPLIFAAIPSETFGAAPFTVSASSASNGTITYSVVSGPATISGNTVLLTGAGVVVLRANQAATAEYAAATATVAFFVAAPPFTLSTGGTNASGASATIAPGGDATFGLTLSPGAVGTFPDALMFSVSGIPAGAAASFSPSMIAAGSGATTVAFTIQLSSSATPNSTSSQGMPSVPLALGVLLMPILGWRSAGRRLLQAPRLLTILTFAALPLCVAASLCGCSGASQQSGATKQSSQTYPIVVTATDQVTGIHSAIDLSLVVD